MRFSVFVALGGILVCFSMALLPWEDDSSLPPAAMPSISGYLEVTASSKMFYAYYEAINPQGPLSSTPIILWLQGGPGCSSMTGNFYELGPWRIAPDLRLHRNEAPWNNRFGLLFIDNPVGSGYSIAGKDEDVPVNQDEVVEHLERALWEFFGSQTALRNRPLFVAGESYAGKYVPSLGYHLITKSKSSSITGFKLRVDGLIIGNGLTHPEVQVQTHAETAYSFGLIDKQQKAHAEQLAGEVVRLVRAEDWRAAHRSRTNLIKWIENASAIATPLDIRRTVPYHCMENGTEFLGLFLNKRSVKAKLGADDAAVWVSCSSRVKERMSNDTMKSVKWMVEELLRRKVPLLLYQGQYDIKDGVVSSEEWMRTLAWDRKQDFFASERSIWRVRDSVAGYWRSLKPLTHVVLVGAGHQAPADQPLHSQQMVERWIDEAKAKPKRLERDSNQIQIVRE